MKCVFKHQCLNMIGLKLNKWVIFANFTSWVGEARLNFKRVSKLHLNYITFDLRANNLLNLFAHYTTHLVLSCLRSANIGLNRQLSEGPEERCLIRYLVRRTNRISWEDRPWPEIQIHSVHTLMSSPIHGCMPRKNNNKKCILPNLSLMFK